jgi:hypothetical protein
MTPFGLVLTLLAGEADNVAGTNEAFARGFQVGGEVALKIDLGRRVALEPGIQVNLTRFAMHPQMAMDGLEDVTIASLLAGVRVSFHGPAVESWLGAHVGYEGWAAGCDESQWVCGHSGLGLHFEAGAGVRLSPKVSLGPYLSYAMSFTERGDPRLRDFADGSVEWLTFGLAGRYGL